MSLSALSTNIAHKSRDTHLQSPPRRILDKIVNIIHIHNVNNIIYENKQ